MNLCEKWDFVLLFYWNGYQAVKKGIEWSVHLRAVWQMNEMDNNWRCFLWNRSIAATIYFIQWPRQKKCRQFFFFVSVIFSLPQSSLVKAAVCSERRPGASDTLEKKNLFIVYVYGRWRIIGLVAEREIKEDWEGEEDVGQKRDCRAYEVSPAVCHSAFREVSIYGFRNCNYDLVQQMKSTGCALSV